MEKGRALFIRPLSDFAADSTETGYVQRWWTSDRVRRIKRQLFEERIRITHNNLLDLGYEALFTEKDICHHNFRYGTPPIVYAKSRVPCVLPVP